MSSSSSSLSSSSLASNPWPHAVAPRTESSHWRVVPKPTYPRVQRVPYCPKPNMVVTMYYIDLGLGGWPHPGKQVACWCGADPGMRLCEDDVLRVTCAYGQGPNITCCHDVGETAHAIPRPQHSWSWVVPGTGSTVTTLHDIHWEVETGGCCTFNLDQLSCYPFPTKHCYQDAITCGNTNAWRKVGQSADPNSFGGFAQLWVKGLSTELVYDANGVWTGSSTYVPCCPQQQTADFFAPVTRTGSSSSNGVGFPCQTGGGS